MAESLVTGLIDQCRIGAVIPSGADEPYSSTVDVSDSRP